MEYLAWGTLFHEKNLKPKISCPFKVHLKKKMYLFVNATTQRCPNKKLELFCLNIFSICHRCQQHLWCNLSCKYLCEFFENSQNGPHGILRGLGETDS